MISLVYNVFLLFFIRIEFSYQENKMLTPLICRSCWGTLRNRQGSDSNPFSANVGYPFPTFSFPSRDGSCFSCSRSVGLAPNSSVYILHVFGVLGKQLVLTKKNEGLRGWGYVRSILVYVLHLYSAASYTLRLVTYDRTCRDHNQVYYGYFCNQFGIYESKFISVLLLEEEHPFLSYFPLYP